jgi:hypothetical protein
MHTSLSRDAVAQQRLLLKLETDGLVQAYRKIGVAYSGTHCLPESVVPVGSQAFERSALRDYGEEPEHSSTVVFAVGMNNSSSSQRPCSGPRVVRGSAAVSLSKSHDLLKGEVGRYGANLGPSNVRPASSLRLRLPRLEDFYPFGRHRHRLTSHLPCRDKLKIRLAIMSHATWALLTVSNRTATVVAR